MGFRAPDQCRVPLVELPVRPALAFPIAVTVCPEKHIMLNPQPILIRTGFTLG